MKKKIIFCCLIVFIFFAVLIARSRLTPPAPLIRGETATKTILIHEKPVTLELVSTPEEIKQGLGDRDSMPLDHGMFFSFAVPGRYSFWMRHMRFPLDIIWIREGVIVDIAEHMPAPGTLEIPATHTPTTEADMVLELNAGQAQAYNLEKGQKIW